MNFAFPDWLHLLWFLPVFLVIIWFAGKRAAMIVLHWFSENELKNHHPQLRMGLRGGGILLLIIALTGPWWGRQEVPVENLAREVYILIDVSASMGTEDIKPSRLEKVKAEVHRMVEEMKGDRFGLIVFAANAYLQCPLTRDYTFYEDMLDLVSGHQFAATGTDYRSALLMALNRFQQMEVRGHAFPRSVVMFSDGEDFGDSYASVLDRLENLHVKVYPVGVGTMSGGKVPDPDRKGAYMRNPDGTAAISQLNDADLRDIAKEFGTEYHVIDESGDDLSPVVKQVKRQKAIAQNTEEMTVANNRYRLFAVPALLMLLGSLVVRPQKKIRGLNPLGSQP